MDNKTNIDTDKVIIDLIKTNAHIFTNLKLDQKTLPVCIAAVETNNSMLRYVPLQYIDDVFKHIIVKTPMINIIDNLPKGYKETKEMYIASVLADFTLLRSYARDHSRLCKKYMTLELFIELVNKYPNIIAYEPYHLWKKVPHEVYVNAIKRNYKLIQYLGIYPGNQDLCDIATDADYKMIIHVPEVNRTKKMCDNAFNLDPSYVKYVPEKFITKEHIDKVLEKNIEIYPHLKNSLKKYYLITYYIIFPAELKELTQDHFTLEFLTPIIKENHGALKYVTLSHFTTLEWCKFIRDTELATFGKVNGAARKEIILAGIDAILKSAR